MKGFVTVAQAIQGSAFLGLCLTSLRRFVRGSGPHAWSAAAFGVLTGLVAMSLALGEESGSDALTKLAVVLLIAFPYFLLRFVGSFDGLSRSFETFAALVTVGAVVWTFELRGLADNRPPEGYVLLVVGQWVVLSWAVARRLWRGARAQPSVVRQRMRLLGAASVGLSSSIIVVAFAPEGTMTRAVLQCIGLAVTGAFILGFAPPGFLRSIWRRPEEEDARRGIQSLVGATRQEDIVRTLLPHAAALVGGRDAILLTPNGAVSSVRGNLTPDMVSNGARNGTGERVAVRLRAGELVVERGPFTPFFGRDEIELLEAFAALADLALDRADLFERERIARHELERLIDTQKDLIANAAHELRTPLTTLTGMATTLSLHRTRMSEEQLEESYQALERQGQRARVLIDNLLSLSRIEQGAPTLESRPTSMIDVVRSVMDAVPTPEGVSVTVDVPAGLIVTSDRLMIEQALLNLIANAYKYGGRNVTVAAATAGHGEVTIAVGDDGPGVPEELVPDLFAPFKRGRSVTGLPGSGLGLTIAQRIAQTLGGWLSYEPASPKGAMFRLTIGTAK